MKLIHCADWHLSAQRGKIDPETGLNARLVDFYRCARFTIEDGLSRGAELVLHAGDVFNSCRPSPTEVRLCREALAPALDADIPVVLVPGNHDSPRSPTERHAVDLLRDTRGVIVADQPAIVNVWREGEQRLVAELAEHGRPYSLPLELQVAAAPWPNKQLLLADEEHRQLEPGELNQLVAEKMLDVIRGLAAELVPDVPAVLLGHFSIDVAEAGGMSRLMALGGDWCLNLHDLTGLPFDAICLGHVHKPQTLHADPPIVAYCGSPEVVDFGEQQEQKGYRLVEVDGEQWFPGSGPGVQGHVRQEWIATPHRRFLTLDYSDPQEVPREALDGAIVRVRLPENALPSEAAAIREDLEKAGVHELTIETQRAETVRRRETDMSAGMDLEAAIKEWLKQNPGLLPEALVEPLLAEAQAVEVLVAGGDE